MRFVRIIPVVLVAVLCLFSQSAHTTVRGHVIDANQNPINGALVTFTDESNPENSFSGHTDADGWYEIGLGQIAVSEETPHPFILDQNYPNPFNPYDMSGNVEELCHDWHGHYPSESEYNPTGGEPGSGRIRRGCDWGRPATNCRSASRDGCSPFSCDNGLGFRVVRRPDGLIY